MWILETDGDVFQGKRLWLRPGKRFLFGRTRAGEGDFAVADKTISRSHLLVEVSLVDRQECVGNPRSRSRVTITDQATKIGTTLNGEQIRSEKDNKVGHVLEKDVNVIVLGKYPSVFRIWWKPIVFTFSYAQKEHKANPYPALYHRLGLLDIKVLVEYEVGSTTHVAARKRNTAKGLQALVDGKYIVDNETYINALEKVATSSEGASPLEVDFDKNFPNPLDYLPAKGDEPTTRDASAYAPQPARNEMFEGYTFVFYEKRQFENLMAPITTGKGKALLHEVIPHQTKVLDFVRYVKGVAGEKGLGEFEDGSEGRGVVVVRFNPVKGGGVEWYKDFTQHVSIHLDHRFVEQNEFLDAILGIDASVLRRPLENSESFRNFAPPSSSVSNHNSKRSFDIRSQSEQAADETTALSQMAPTRGRGRRTQSRFKGFDDDDDNFSVPQNSISESMRIDPPPSAPGAMEPESQGLFVSQDSSAEIVQPRRSPTPPPVRPTRKRMAQSDDAFMDSIAPAATAVKRRKIAEESERRLRGESTPPPAQAEPNVEPKKEPPTPQPKSKSKKNAFSKADAAAIEAARLKAERLAKEKDEALEAELDGIPAADIRKLTIIEDMPIGRTQPGPERAIRADESERWDEAWNGRKNFKRFKRRGGEEGGVRVRKVIVRLEEAKTRDYGIGEDYWLEGKDESQRRRKKMGREGQDESLVSDPQSQARSNGSMAAPQLVTRVQAVGDSDDDMDVDDELEAAVANILHHPAEENGVPSSSDVEVVATRPSQRSIPASKPTSTSSTTRSATSRTQVASSISQRTTQTLADKTNKSQNLQESSASSSKRGAGSALAKQPAAKKAKVLFGRKEESEEEESDDDGLAFKFKKKS